MVPFAFYFTILVSLIKNAIRCKNAIDLLITLNYIQCKFLYQKEKEKLNENSLS